MAFVAFDGPDGTSNEARLGCDVIEPDHGTKGFERFVTCCFIAGDRVFERHRGEIMCSVASIIIADLAEPTVLLSGPIKLVDEAKPFEAPILHFTLKERGLF